MATYDLGTLVGGHWKQCCTSIGQDYYQNLTTNETQFSIPPGFQDASGVIFPPQYADNYNDQLQDTWHVDNSRPWKQWRNTRTGRITRDDPNPPPPQTYLDLRGAQAFLQTVERVPESATYLYRRVLVPVLQFFFPLEENFLVMLEESRGETTDHDSKPDASVLKIISCQQGSFYDCCLVKCKKPGESWIEMQDRLMGHCVDLASESKQVYGMIQIGLEVQFFRANSEALQPLSGRLHLVRDVNNVTTMMLHMKQNPLQL